MNTIKLLATWAGRFLRLSNKRPRSRNLSRHRRERQERILRTCPWIQQTPRQKPTRQNAPVYKTPGPGTEPDGTVSRPLPRSRKKNERKSWRPRPLPRVHTRPLMWDNKEDAANRCGCAHTTFSRQHSQASWRSNISPVPSKSNRLGCIPYTSE